MPARELNGAGDGEQTERRYPDACPACGRITHLEVVSVGRLRPIRRCGACDVTWAIPRERRTWSPDDDAEELRRALRRLGKRDWPRRPEQ